MVAQIVDGQRAYKRGHVMRFQKGTFVSYQLGKVLTIKDSTILWYHDVTGIIDAPRKG